MMRLYRCRPSELLHVEEDYAAWCLDEACLFAQMEIDEGKQPIFRAKYSSFSDIYKGLEKGGVVCR